MNPNVIIESVHMEGYLNLVSQTMKEMKIPQTIDRIVDYDAQCRVSPGEVVQMIVMDMLTGRQALVHMEEWASRLDVEKLLRSGLQASFFNDDSCFPQRYDQQIGVRRLSESRGNRFADHGRLQP